MKWVLLAAWLCLGVVVLAMFVTLLEVALLSEPARRDHWRGLWRRRCTFDVGPVRVRARKLRLARNGHAEWWTRQRDTWEVLPWQTMQAMARMRDDAEALNQVGIRKERQP